MKARLRSILDVEAHKEEARNVNIQVCRTEIDIQAAGRGPGASDGWHNSAIILYTDTVQEGARIGLACVDAINALKDEEKMR